MAGTDGQGFAQFDESLSELIEEAEEYEERAESDPTAVVSELPRLLALLESTGMERQEVVLRDAVLETIRLIAIDDPTALDDLYSDIVEAMLDTEESKALTWFLLHESVELVARDVSVQTIAEGFELAVDELAEASNAMTADLDTDGRLPSNGATAMAMRHHLADYANAVEGREQLAVEAVVEALDGSVEYHAAQQGIDPIDGYIDLRSRYETESDPFTLGFSRYGSIKDMIEEDETESWDQFGRKLINVITGAVVILAVEESVERVLRAEAVIAEQI